MKTLDSVEEHGTIGTTFTILFAILLLAWFSKAFIPRLTTKNVFDCALHKYPNIFQDSTKNNSSLNLIKYCKKIKCVEVKICLQYLLMLLGQC